MYLHRMFLPYYSVVGVPGKPWSSLLQKKFSPAIFNCFWYGPVPDLLRNTVALESMVYDTSLSSYDPECQKFHRNMEYSTTPTSMEGKW